MWIKKLTIHGYKAFKGDLVLRFDQRYNWISIDDDQKYLITLEIISDGEFFFFVNFHGNLFTCFGSRRIFCKRFFVNDLNHFSAFGMFFNTANGSKTRFYHGPYEVTQDAYVEIELVNTRESPIKVLNFFFTQRFTKNSLPFLYFFPTEL